MPGRLETQVLLLAIAADETGCLHRRLTRQLEDLQNQQAIMGNDSHPLLGVFDDQGGFESRIAPEDLAGGPAKFGDFCRIDRYGLGPMNHGPYRFGLGRVGLG